MKTIVIPAKRGAKCGICGKEYSPGTRIALDKRTGKWTEADCLWPGKIGKIAKNQAQTQEETISEVSARLDAAIEIMCQRFNKQPIDVNPDSYVLAEIMRQLYGQQWLDKGFGK